MEPKENAVVPHAPGGVPSEALDGHAALRLHPLLYLLAAIVAGAAFFGIYQAVFPIYRVPKDLLQMFPSEEDAAAREVAFNWARAIHAAISLGTLGLLLGGLLGAGEAATRRFAGGTLARLVAAAILSTALGCLGGLLGSYIWIRTVPFHLDHQLGWAMVSQICMMGLLGIGVGLAVGLVIGRGRTLLSAAVAGSAAGVLAAILFPIVFGLLLPHVATDVVIPDGSGGIFGCVSQRGLFGLIGWIGFPVVAIGLILPIVNRRRKSAASLGWDI